MKRKFVNLKSGLVLATVLFCFWVTPGRAQDSNLGAWYMYFGSQPLGKGFNWHNEVQYRNYNLGGDLEQLLLRTGIGYNLTENNNNLLLGYGYIHSRPYTESGEKFTTTEHRIFQQFITRQQFGRFHIQHRYRLEERMLKEDFRMRFRYFLNAVIPFTEKQMNPGGWYFGLYNEIFLHLDAPAYDRNRVFGALGYVAGKNLRFELGYMHQFMEQGGLDQLQFGIFNSAPFSAWLGRDH